MTFPEIEGASVAEPLKVHRQEAPNGWSLKETLIFSVWTALLALFQERQDRRVQPLLKKGLRLAKQKNSAFPCVALFGKSKTHRQERETRATLCLRNSYQKYRKTFNQRFLKFKPQQMGLQVPCDLDSEVPEEKAF